MHYRSFPSISAHRTRIIALAAIYIVLAAVVLRTLAWPSVQAHLPLYLAMEFIYVGLFTAMLWHPITWQPGQHLYFAIQTLLVLTLLLIDPRFDFIAVLFVILAFEAALVFPRSVRVVWIAFLILLIFIPLTAAQGIYGLAVSLFCIASAIIFPAYVVVDQELEAGLRASQALLDELQTANQQLTAYAAQVEEISIIREHNRLARQLHDSVSQSILSIIQHNHSARQILNSDPEHLGAELDELQNLAQGSLEQMRSLIASLRPSDPGSVGRPTPLSE